jgi:hypothetical protein
VERIRNVPAAGPVLSIIVPIGLLVSQDDALLAGSSVTGLWNRRAFDERFSELVAETGGELGVLIAGAGPGRGERRRGANPASGGAQHGRARPHRQHWRHPLRGDPRATTIDVDRALCQAKSRRCNRVAVAED